MTDRQSYNNFFILITISFFFGLQVIANTEGCTRKSLNENAALIDNPESYRLSCITNVYEDVTLEVMGPIGEAAMLSKA